MEPQIAQRLAMMERSELNAGGLHLEISRGKIRLRRQTVGRKAFSNLRQQSVDIGVIQAEYRKAVERNFVDKIKKAFIKLFNRLMKFHVFRFDVVNDGVVGGRKQKVAAVF